MKKINHLIIAFVLSLSFFLLPLVNVNAEQVFTKGEEVTYTFTEGQPNVMYSIKVVYPSGNEATSKDVTKTILADESGHASWTWKISKSVKTGTGGTITVFNFENKSIEKTETFSVQDEYGQIDSSKDIEEVEKHEDEYGKITKVIDAMTYEVLVRNNTYTIRLIGIDTANDPAVDRYAEKYVGKEVIIEYDTLFKDDDGRRLAYLHLPDGALIQQDLLVKGYAEYKASPPNIKYTDDFRNYANLAKGTTDVITKEKPVVNGDPTLRNPLNLDRTPQNALRSPADLKVIENPDQAQSGVQGNLRSPDNLHVGQQTTAPTTEFVFGYGNNTFTYKNGIPGKNYLFNLAYPNGEVNNIGIQKANQSGVVLWQWTISNDKPEGVGHFSVVQYEEGQEVYKNDYTLVDNTKPINQAPVEQEIHDIKLPLDLQDKVNVPNVDNAPPTINKATPVQVSVMQPQQQTASETAVTSLPQTGQTDVTFASALILMLGVALFVKSKK